ncbi:MULTISPECIES: zinc-binding dehydrogenase [Streptomyces]|uniref:zinc-binding dehydrogenase n=1 Tax=Streptomyces TaxID=1883 RepID=UPI0034385ABF
MIDRTFDLSAIADAHRHMEANGQVGKVIVTVRHRSGRSPYRQPSRDRASACRLSVLVGHRGQPGHSVT